MNKKYVYLVSAQKVVKPGDTLEFKEVNNMRIFTNEELRVIIKKHMQYLNGELDGRKADLRKADLRRADLSDADLRGADLRGANLSDADLSGANLSDADLSDADLSDADLRGANLRGANLSDARLSDADLRGANLRGANLNPPMACPSEGNFIGWKKALVDNNGMADEALVKLEIPEDAKRSSATTRKCRTNKAKVLDIVLIESGLHSESAYSIYDNSFIYYIGEMVEVADFDDNRFNECSTGIHFFIDREEAIRYMF